VAAALRSQEERLSHLLETLAQTREREAHALAEAREQERLVQRSQYDGLVARLTTTIQSLLGQLPSNTERCEHEAPRAVPGGNFQMPVRTEPVGQRPAPTNEPGPSGIHRGAEAVQDDAGAHKPAPPRARYLDLAVLLTVEDVRKEFEEDVPGKRSFNWMDANLSMQWRKEYNVDRRRVADVKLIYDAVVLLAQHRGISRITAANLLDGWRRRERWSIRQLWEKIRPLRVLATKNHENATREVKDIRIKRDFGELLASHCLQV
jgi:hypothetical protein